MEMQKYLFWFEDEGKYGWTFIIEAMDSDEAFEKAYDTHGPQVEDMMYQLINENNTTPELLNPSNK